MSFSYMLRESFSGFQRTKLSSTISVLTICISLLLLGVFAVVTVNTARFIEVLRNKVDLEAFLQEPLTDEEIADLKKSVTGIEGVEKVILITKDEAAAIFQREFGERYDAVLDFNPFPPSFTVTLRRPYRTAAHAQRIRDQLAALKGIESVRYRKALIELIDERTKTVNAVTLGLGLLISLSAIFLVSNTIRLAIYAKRKLIRTMGLVGATETFIRLPFLLEGIIQGFMGGVLAAGILYAVFEHGARLLSAELAGFVHMEPTFYLLVIAAGTVLGMVGSIISVFRFIRVSDST